MKLCIIVGICSQQSELGAVREGDAMKQIALQDLGSIHMHPNLVLFLVLLFSFGYLKFYVFNFFLDLSEFFWIAS